VVTGEGRRLNELTSGRLSSAEAEEEEEEDPWESDKPRLLKVKQRNKKETRVGNFESCHPSSNGNS